MGYFTTVSTHKRAQTCRESLHDSGDMEQTQGLEPEEPEELKEPEEPAGLDDTEELTPLPLPKTKRGRKPKVLVVDDTAEEQREQSVFDYITQKINKLTRHHRTCSPHTTSLK